MAPEGKKSSHSFHCGCNSPGLWVICQGADPACTRGETRNTFKKHQKTVCCRKENCAVRETVLIIYGLAKAGFDIPSNTMLSSAFCTEEDRFRANTSLICSSGTSNSAHLVKPFAGNPSETGKSLSHPCVQEVQY